MKLSYFACPRHASLSRYSNNLPGSFAHWASENEQLLVQQKNLLVQGDRMVLFFSPVTSKFNAAGNTAMD